MPQRPMPPEARRPRAAGERLTRLFGLPAAATALAALAALALTPAAPAAAADLPALVSPPGTEHHRGKMVFAELVTPDLGAAKRFYGGLFGWSFQDAGGGVNRFTQASVDGRVVAGIVQRAIPTGRRPAWLSFIAVDDAARAAALAKQSGGKLLFEPHRIAALGQEAILADPQGAVFAVLASSSGDPPDLLAEPGAWIWSSLITTDPGADAAFYRSLFGYDVFDLPGAQDARHLILASESYARASVNPIPSSRPGAHPRWVSYLRVDDATAMAARVVAMGGRVVLPPQLDRHGGKIALVADPQGALFGLLEWPGDATRGAAR